MSLITFIKSKFSEVSNTESTYTDKVDKKTNSEINVFDKNPTQNDAEFEDVTLNINTNIKVIDLDDPNTIQTLSVIRAQNYINEKNNEDNNDLNPEINNDDKDFLQIAIKLRQIIVESSKTAETEHIIKSELKMKPGETKEEFAVRQLFMLYISNRSMGDFLSMAGKAITKSEWSAENVYKKVEEKLAEHDIEGAKAIIAEFEEKIEDEGRVLSKAIGIILGTVVTGGYGIIAGAGVAAVMTFVSEVDGDFTKEEAIDGIKDSVKTGATIVISGAAGKAIQGAGTAVTAGGKIAQGAAKGAASGASLGLTSSVVDDGVDYITGEKELTEENLKKSAKKAGFAALVGAAAGAIIDGITTTAGIIMDKLSSTFAKKAVNKAIGKSVSKLSKVKNVTSKAHPEAIIKTKDQLTENIK